MTYPYFSRCGGIRRHAYAVFATPSARATNAWQRYEHRRHGHGGSFGVRRPLRYLAHRLDLDDSQVRRLAIVLDRLKSEREQARLDDERAMSRVAELLLDGELPEKAAFDDALRCRRDSQERLEAEATQALVHIAELLDPD
ncbi:MAG: hypothetical protein AAGG11_18770, partial [Pseudomonadota bacterium]